MKFALLALATLAGAGLMSSAHAEVVTLNAATSLPANNVFSQRFAAYADLVNEKGKGVVQIKITGGPEVIPGNQQDTALRNGVIDMQSGPSSYYVGTLPEANAFKGATIDAATVRDKGAFDMLNQAWNERVNAELIAWLGGGVKFYIYMSSEPEFNEDGSLDLSGVKLRSAPTYRDWFDSMGAENVMLPVSDIFTAMERGVIAGFGSPVFASQTGALPLVNYRVGPGVWRNDVVIMVNHDKWETLSPEAQKILSDAGREIEELNEGFYADMIAKEVAEEQKEGVEIIEIEGEAGQQHIEKASDTVWKVIEQEAPEAAAKLKPIMYPEG